LRRLAPLAQGYAAPRMGKVVASLAAVLAGLALVGCGGGGAEPGAPKGATLVLDFTPNAVHSGIYTALARGYYRDAGVDLTVRQPSASTDAPKLLEAGRADFAILDIHDLGIARERGIDVVGVVPIVQRPLASVIARADGPVRRPRDLQGRRVGVTGLPSDDAVVDSEVAADGGPPAKVDRVTIGFNAVADLAAGRVDAATGFWNAEAVALARKGVAERTFKVDDYGAPSYPELVLSTTAKTARDDPALVREVAAATARGYEAVIRDPKAGLDDLLAANPDLDRAEQQAQMRVLLPAFSPPGRLSRPILEAWARWDLRHGILSRPLDVEAAFDHSLISGK
jgi:putative hydroxymethylpyrimidine transport system substrate-binding protein